MIFCFIAGGVALILGVFFLIRTYKTGSTETKVSMVCFGLGVIGILEGIAINIDSTLLMCLAPAIAIIGGPLLQIALLGIVSYLIEIIIKAQEKDGKGLLRFILRSIIVVIVLVAIIAFIVIMVQECDSNSNQTKYNFDEVDMKIIAKDEVKKELKAPSTAEFSNISATENNGVWTITGYVDAENSFGAMIRNKFKVIIEDNGKPYYTVLSVVIY